ncbi:dihydrofolate reductase [Georgenia yuyongxinii]|uniref:Dihydrofolate reductase n=1 Tax=Georgenia yuyongxinii TaxID=2589797 RepID=A0A5B8C6J7_9MICO|nr:dihydrofolate reductase family protein [Georgenia yuyongxinii]QDC25021.1 dihydrofolate reductase [Georgenia yuyongxinii]
MGTVIYSLSMSLDGFVETPSRSLDWVQVDEELHSFFNEQSRKVTTSLYGRRMYELMAGYWPTAPSDPDASPVEREFAEIWAQTPKVVFSSTLREVGWNSRLVRGDPVEEVRRLKADPAAVIDVGGPALAGTLIRAGLVDEYGVAVHPVVLGAGTPYLPALDQRLGLRLLETRNFASGVVFLRYAAETTTDAAAERTTGAATAEPDPS